MTVDCNGQTLKIGYRVAVLGKMDVWDHTIYDIYTEEILLLTRSREGRRIGRVTRLAKNVRKLRIEELI